MGQNFRTNETYRNDCETNQITDYQSKGIYTTPDSIQNKKEYLTRQLEEDGVKITDTQASSLLLYFDMLNEWNKKMNLTAITDFQEVVEKHFRDSLSLAKLVNKEKLSLIDVGTGAGFPGIPLKIIFPGWSVLLLDSLNKRVTFLNEVIKMLKLDQISAVHGRAEELARNLNYREKYDLCVSRAVARLASLTELCLPFVKIGGHFIAYKSTKTDEELKEAQYAIGTLGGKLVKKTEFHFSEETAVRFLIDIEKEKPTSEKYPRGGGKPISQPLVSK